MKKSSVFATILSLVLFTIFLNSASAQIPQDPSSGGCVIGSTYIPACDVDQNGVIDVNDLQRVASRWGTSGTFVSDAWQITGNSNTDSNLNFLGTTDAKPLIFKTNGQEAMRIDGTTGYVGIGTATPGVKFHVVSTDTVQDVVVIQGQATQGGSVPFRVEAAPQSTYKLIARFNHAVYLGWLDINVNQNGDASLDSKDGQKNLLLLPNGGNVGIGTTSPAYKLDVAGVIHSDGFSTLSDTRAKDNVTQISNALDKLEKIRGVTYSWKENTAPGASTVAPREIGVIAQEVEAQFPELVTAQGAENYKSVDYGKMSAVLVEAVKELKADQDSQIAVLKAENKSLKTQMGSLEGRLAVLEQSNSQTHPSFVEYFLIFSNLMMALAIGVIILLVLKQRQSLPER